MGCRQTAGQMSPHVTPRSAAAIYILPPTVSEAAIRMGSEMTVVEMRIREASLSVRAFPCTSKSDHTSNLIGIATSGACVRGEAISGPIFITLQRPKAFNVIGLRQKIGFSCAHVDVLSESRKLPGYLGRHRGPVTSSLPLSPPLQRRGRLQFCISKSQCYFVLPLMSGFEPLFLARRRDKLPR